MIYAEKNRMIFQKKNQGIPTLDIDLIVVSVACHDPDFVLAEGTHQVADTLCIGLNDFKT